MIKNVTIFILFFLSLSFKSQAKRFEVSFINSQENICVVYLDDHFAGTIESGKTFTTKIKGGTHDLSFVVFLDNGDYYTYKRDLFVNNDNTDFLLKSNDSGYVHLEKFEGINPLVLASIQRLPILTEELSSITFIKVKPVEFEAARFEQLKSLVINHRLDHLALIRVLEQLDEELFKKELAEIAYQHLIDKHNYHHVIFTFSEDYAKALQLRAEKINRYL